MSLINYKRAWSKIFIAYSLLYFLLSFTMNNYVLTDSYYFSALSSQLDIERITEIIEQNKKIVWIVYLINPVSLLLKWLLISGSLFTVYTLSDREFSFSNFLWVTGFAEAAFFTQNVCRVIFLLQHPPKSISALENLNFLSLTSVFELRDIPKYLHYLVTQVNLFEALYILMITLGLKKVTKDTWGKSLEFCLMGYLPVFFLIIVVVTFLKLQFDY